MTTLSMRIATVATAVAAWSCLSLASCSGPPAKKVLTPEEMVQMDPLPLAKGAKWTYNVTFKRTDPDSDKEITRTIEWVTEVVDAREADGVTAYRIRGWPTDLDSTARMAGPLAPTDAGSGGSAAAAAPGAGGGEAMPVATERTLLRKGNAFLWGATPGEPTLFDAEGWFQWPVHNGEKICPSALVAYCWLVSSVDSGYALTYYTGPDDRTYDLEPGTGVSRYHYKHHGTTNEVEAKLVSHTNGK
jgi:hypothetical protein